MEKIYQVNESNYDECLDRERNYTYVFFTEKEARDYVESSISKIKKDFDLEAYEYGANEIENWEFSIVVLNRDYSTEVIYSVELSADEIAKNAKRGKDYLAHAK